MYRNIFLSIVFIIAAFKLKAQYYNGHIRIDSIDRSYIFQVTDKKRKTSKYNYLYWFKSGRIHQTQGSYYGKLLHGNYKVTDADRHLLEEGQFKKGTKTGVWRTWYENGTLRSTRKKYSWFLKNVYKIREYDAAGNTTKTGFENRKGFTGYQVEWKEDSAHVAHYKKGVVITPKAVTVSKK